MPQKPQENKLPPNKSAKQRLDQVLVELGLCPSRQQAQGLILSGRVLLDGQVLDKPGHQLNLEKLAPNALSITETNPFVSRGGLKLAKAIEVFGLNVQNRTCIDVGASTGGFTDCLLQNGAHFVTALDVGHGQLDWKLRQDPRVLCLEKTNIRHFTPEMLTTEQKPSLAVTDVSFISLLKVLGNILTLVQPEKGFNTPEVVALIKPQFEFKDFFPKAKFDGVVKNQEQHQTIVFGVLKQVQTSYPDWMIAGLSDSPIEGPKGNREFLLYLKYLPLTAQPHTDEALQDMLQSIIKPTEPNL